MRDDHHRSTVEKVKHPILRDRDRVYGKTLPTLAAEMQITEVLTASRSPWQNPYVEKLIGSIRRERLDHVIVMTESSLRRQIACYLDYYHDSRSHLSLGQDCPDGRAVEPPELGRIVAVPKVGRASPSIPTPSRIKYLPPVILYQREEYRCHGATQRGDFKRTKFRTLY